MPTYRDLFEKLATLSPEQLDSEIKIIPAGYTDGEAAELMRYDILPQVLELAKASRDLYHFAPSEDGEWCEPGVCDFSSDEIKDMGIDQDEDYVLLCKKGELIFKLKDNIAFAPAGSEAKVGDLNTGIMPW